MEDGESVGIDVGGTFTDLVVVGPGGDVRAGKVVSTPRDQGVGVERALHQHTPRATTVSRIVHGTTVVTNLLLERKGSRVVLCATAGATDLLELRRQERASLYDLSAQHPTPLVPTDRVVAVDERAAPEGILRPLQTAEADGVAERVASLAPDIVAVALLHAYAFPQHERALAEALRRRLPGVDVVCSSEVLPEIREYERTATTCAEAYARPRVATYLGGLSSRLQTLGYPAPGVMSSSGGMIGASDAARGAASLALSGPAGGVAGAALVARLAGIDRALTIDIGGTSADVGLVLDGEPLVEAGGQVGGVPIALPRVLVETVSAGGGSIAWVDDGGALRVGPRSAGSEPGPAAFARGGTDATVTDAHVVLGNIVAGVLSDRVQLDAAAAHAAVGRVASRLGGGISPGRAAEAMVATADAAMARALRRVSVERGVDPRACALIAFGGGGPLHACGLAEALGIRRVLIPPHAGVLSALGLAVAPERRGAMASVMRDANGMSQDEADTLLAGLRAQVAFPGGRISSVVRARYQGQGHELEIPMHDGDSGNRLVERFSAQHHARYGFTLDLPVELVSARSEARGEAPHVTLQRAVPATPNSPSTGAVAPLLDTGGVLEKTVRGRCVVALPDATLLVREGWTGHALPMGGWMLEQG